MTLNISIFPRFPYPCYKFIYFLFYPSYLPSLIFAFFSRHHLFVKQILLKILQHIFYFFKLNKHFSMTPTVDLSFLISSLCFLSSSSIFSIFSSLAMICLCITSDLIFSLQSYYGKLLISLLIFLRL